MDDCVRNLDKETYNLAGSRYAMQCYPDSGLNIWSSESFEVVSFFNICYFIHFEVVYVL